MSQQQPTRSRRQYISNGQSSCISNGAGCALIAQIGSEYYPIDKFSCINAHGYMAERVCTRRYNFWGLPSLDIGFNNRTKGPDLLVGSVQVQVKYCRSAQATLSAFIKKGVWTYMDGDKFMDIEVPSDQFTEIKEGLRELIRKGKVLGLTDPKMADTLIRKGPCSYEKVVRMCDAGTIEGLTYDAQTGLITAVIVGSMSFLLNVAHKLYDCRDRDDLIQTAAMAALRDSAIAGTSHLFATQIARTAYVRGTARVAADIFVKSLPKAIQHSLARTSLNRTISGAAAQAHLSRLVRINAVALITLTLAETGRTAARLATNTISSHQAGHDFIRNLSGLVAGLLGWQTGFAACSLLLPGSPIFAFAGAFMISGAIGVAGSMSASQVSTLLLGETDDEKLARLILTASVQVQAESFLFYQPDLVASICSSINNPDVRRRVLAVSGPTQQYDLVLQAARSVVAQWEHLEAFEPIDAALTGLQTAYYLSDSDLLEVAQKASDVPCRSRVVKSKDQMAMAFECCREVMMTLPDCAVFDVIHKALVHLQEAHSLTDAAVTALGQAMVTPQKRNELSKCGGDHHAACKVGEGVLAVWRSN